MAIPFLSGLRVHDSITLSDSKPIKWDTNNILSHNGTQTYLGDATSASILTLNGGNATFAGKVQVGAISSGTLNENTGVKLAIIGDGGDNNDGLIITRDNGNQNQLDQFINIYSDGTSTFVTSGGTSTHGTFDFKSTNDKGDTSVSRLSIDASGNATFANLVTVGPGTTGSPYDSTTFLHIKGTTRSIVQQSSTADAYYMFGDAAANNVGWIGYNHSSGNANIQAENTITLYKPTNVVGTFSASGNATFEGNLIIHHSSNAPYIDFVESGAITDSKARITMDQVDTDNGQLIFSTENAGTLTTAITIDNQQRATFTANSFWGDNKKLIVGTGSDLQIYHASGASYIENDTGDLNITQNNGSGEMIFTQNNDDGNINFNCDDGSGGVTTYLSLDGGDGVMNAYVELRFPDGIKSKFGSDQDFLVYHDGSNAKLTNSTGGLYLGSNTGIGFQSADHNTTFLTLTSSAATYNTSILMGNTVVNPASGFADQTGIGLKYSTTVPEIQVSSDSTALQLGRTSTGGNGIIMAMRYASNTIHTFSTNAVSIGTTMAVNADFKVTGTGEDTFIIGPQTAGSGTILMSLNAAENGYEPLRLDVETFKVTASGGTSPCIIETSGLNTTFGGEVNVPSGKISILGGNNLTISGTAANHAGLSFGTNIIYPATAAGTNDNTFDLGDPDERFKDAYFGGTVNAANVTITGTLSGAGSFVPVGGGTFTGKVTYETPSGGVAFNIDAFTDNYGTMRFRTNGNANKWDLGIKSDNDFYIYNQATSTQAFELDTANNNATFAGDVGMVTGHSSGKFAVMSSAVHGSYDFYNNGTSYFNGDVTIDANITQTTGTTATFTGIVTTDKIFVAKGQNVSHGTSQIKISQENTTKSQIRFYGADTSTAGILEFTGSSSNGSVGGTRLTIGSDGYVGMGIVDTNNQRLTLAEADANGSHIKMNNSRTGGGYWVNGVGDDGSSSSIVPPGGIFWYNGTTRMVIDSSGKVGINKTSPEEKLDIAGSVLISNNEFYKVEKTDGTNYKIAGLTNGNMIQIGAIDYTSAGTVFAGGDNISITTGGAAGTTRMKILSTGSVGIGVTPFAHSLGTSVNVDLLGNGGIWGYAGATYVNSNAYYDSGWKYKSNGEAAALQVGGSSNTLTFRQAASGTADSAITYTEAFRVHTNGNVGIGVNSPGQKLEVNGTVKGTIAMFDTLNNRANSANIIYRSGTDTIVGGGSSTQKLKIEDGGDATFEGLNVGIATSSYQNTAANRGSLTIGGSAAGTFNIGNGAKNFGIYATTSSSSVYSVSDIVFETGSSYTTALTLNSNQSIEDVKGSLSYQLGDVTFAQNRNENGAADSTAGYHKMAEITTTRSGKVRVTFAAYIQSGSYYWSWRILKGGGSAYHKLNSLSVGASHANGSDGTNAGSSYQNGLASGQSASVHAYRNYQIDIKDVVAGETIEIWMASSDASGGNVTGNGQYLYLKDFRLKSLAPVINNMAVVPGSLVIDTSLAVDLPTHYSALVLDGASSGGRQKISFSVDGDQKAYIQKDNSHDLVYYMPASRSHQFWGSGSHRLQIGGDVTVQGSTDLVIAGASRRISFTSGSGTVKTTTGNSLILQTDNANGIVIDGSTQHVTIPQEVGIGTSTTTGGFNVNNSESGSYYNMSNADSGNYKYTNNNGRLLTSNGTGWVADGRDPILTLSSGGNSNATTIGYSLGLNLYNHSNTAGTYSPLICFSGLSSSESYASTYAAIGGKKHGTGPDSNWNTGELHFWVAGTPGTGAGGSTSYMQVTPALKIDASSNSTFNGNIIGRSDHTSELGSYADGQIKRIRMSQGGEVVLGDSSTANPIGLTEGVWNSFSDQDYVSMYSRNSFRVYGYGVDTSPHLHMFVGKHNNGARSVIIGGGTGPNGTYGASNSILTVKGSTSGGEGLVEITGLGNNAGDNVGALLFHSQAEADPMCSIRSIRGSADDQGILSFSTNNGGTDTERMRIDKTGEVQIKSANKLKMSRADNARHTFLYTDNSYGTLETDVDPILIKSANRTEFRTSGTERMRIDAGYAALQIGGTSSAGFIDFDGTSLQFNTQRNPNTGTFVNTSKSHAYIYVYGGNNDSYIRFGTNDANNNAANERMRITKTGNIGIGIDSPNSKLQVRGTVNTLLAHFGGQNNTNGQWNGISLGYAENANASYRKVAIVAEARGDGAARQNLHFLVDTVSDGNSASLADAKMTIDGITGNTSFASSISITGTVTASSDVVAYSDERLKTDVETLDGSKVYNMRGVSFTKDDKKGSGVIAQELEKIAPELVNNDSEFKSVAYGNITGYLIEAIKDLKAEVEELKKQIK